MSDDARRRRVVAAGGGGDGGDGGNRKRCRCDRSRPSPAAAMNAYKDKCEPNNAVVTMFLGHYG